jgi:hypothetical protein
MAELSPQHVVNNDRSVAAQRVTDVNASSHDSDKAAAAKGISSSSPPHTTHPVQEHQQPPPRDSATPDPNVSQDATTTDPKTLHDSREQDNATPDPVEASKLAVKKPLSFKPVSATRSFLAKSATTPGNTPPPVKVAEKRAPSTLLPPPNPQKPVLTRPKSLSPNGDTTAQCKATSDCKNR